MQSIYCTLYIQYIQGREGGTGSPYTYIHTVYTGYREEQVVHIHYTQHRVGRNRKSIYSIHRVGRNKYCSTYTVYPGQGGTRTVVHIQYIQGMVGNLLFCSFALCSFPLVALVALYKKSKKNNSLQPLFTEERKSDSLFLIVIPSFQVGVEEKT